MSDGGWIGVDLDGTLAKYDGFKGITHIGEPIPEMVGRVKSWLTQGRDVRVFTARASGGPLAILTVRKWTLTHIGQYLPVTNVKDMAMDELYDDRAVQVEKNTGRIVGYSTRGLLTP